MARVFYVALCAVLLLYGDVIDVFCFCEDCDPGSKKRSFSSETRDSLLNDLSWSLSELDDPMTILLWALLPSVSLSQDSFHRCSHSMVTVVTIDHKGSKTKVAFIHQHLLL